MTHSRPPHFPPNSYETPPHRVISTGFRDLDEQLGGGLHRQQLTILGGRPGMGKLALALNIVQRVAATTAPDGRPLRVAVWSLGMPAKDIMKRHISSEAQVDLSRLLKRELNEEEWARITNAGARLSQYHAQVHDNVNTTVAAMLAEVHCAAREGNPYDLVILDYLQLLSPDKGIDRAEELTLMSQDLKKLVQEYDVALLVLCQLSHNVEQRSNYRPMLFDLHELGGVEQNADTVMFIYRDEYYNKETDQQDIAEIIIGKQWNGPVGTVKLQFYATHVRFENLTRP